MKNSKPKPKGIFNRINETIERLMEQNDLLTKENEQLKEEVARLTWQLRQQD